MKRPIFWIGAVVLAARIAGAEDLETPMLAAHNAVRATVKAPPLVWSQNLAHVAQEWANTLIGQRSITHRPKSKYGENIYVVEGSKTTAEKAVERWASEAANYDRKSNKCTGSCGHYTQVVWSATKEVGCGVARERGREVWVCEYNPPGNFVGQRPY